MDGSQLSSIEGLPSLEDLAAGIRDDLAIAHDRRVSAAIKLVAVQTQLSCCPKSLHDWCGQNAIRISRTELYLLLAVGSAPDPHARLREERNRARDGMRRHREKEQTDDDYSTVEVLEEDHGIRHVTDVTVEELHRLWDAFCDAHEAASPMVRQVFKSERRAVGEGQ